MHLSKTDELRDLHALKGPTSQYGAARQRAFNDPFATNRERSLSSPSYGLRKRPC